MHRNNLKDFGNKRVPDLIREALDKYTTEELRLGVPARVINVSDYESLQCVDVVPVISEEYDDNEILQQAQIKRVFVKIPNGGGFSIKLPIAVGDLVTLKYSNRYLGKFLDGEGGDVIQSQRFYPSERDCWVEHGFGTRKNHQSPSQTNLIIEGANTTIIITPEGEIKIDTSGTSYIKSAGHTIDTDVTITGDCNIGGTCTAPTVDATSSLLASGAEVVGHNHNNTVPPLS